MLGRNFVGQTREDAAMFIVDCIVEGIEGNCVSYFLPFKAGCHLPFDLSGSPHVGRYN